MDGLHLSQVSQKAKMPQTSSNTVGLPGTITGITIYTQASSSVDREGIHWLFLVVHQLPAGDDCATYRPFVSPNHGHVSALYAHAQKCSCEIEKQGLACASCLHYLSIPTSHAQIMLAQVRMGTSICKG